MAVEFTGDLTSCDPGEIGIQAVTAEIIMVLIVRYDSILRKETIWYLERNKNTQDGI